MTATRDFRLQGGAVHNQNLCRVYHARGARGKTGPSRRARRSSTCTSDDGAPEDSDVAAEKAEREETHWRSCTCYSNGRRETGGIKLLQTITFNEKVNATSRGLARTWMQMCRRRVISKQSSPPFRYLLFLPFLSLSLSLFLTPSLSVPSLALSYRRGAKARRLAHPFVRRILVYLRIRVE